MYGRPGVRASASGTAGQARGRPAGGTPGTGTVADMLELITPTTRLHTPWQEVHDEWPGDAGSARTKAEERGA